MDNFGFLYAFINSGIINKIVFVFLLLLSIYSWSLILFKYKAYQKLNKEYKTISFVFNKRSMIDITNYTRDNHYSIYAKFTNFILDSRRNNKNKNFDESRIQGEIILSQATSDIAKGIGILASIANSAPFIGLFGTVLGVINSFEKIGETSSASLAVIAPGIAEALYATALGLFVAIPASVAFNFFAGKIEEYDENHRLLLEQLLYIIERE